MYLWLDESGDLGFDFQTKRPSHFFVITLLALPDLASVKAINNVVTKTLDKKINHKNKRRRVAAELKGSATTLEVKKYFLNSLNRQVPELSLYSIVLDKKLLLASVKQPISERVYSRMTHQLLEKIDFSSIAQVNLVVDRSRNTLGIKEFNDYLYTNLTLCLNLQAKLYIVHDCSEKQKGIQAVDMFCHGIARKYERNDDSWYGLFKDKIKGEYKFKV